MAVALTQDIRFAVGFKTQADLVTALAAADMWSLTGTAIDLYPEPKNEDNAKDLGHGVYPTQNFPSHIEATGQWNGRMTSEAMAMIALYGLSNGATKTTPATGAKKYVATAPDLLSGLDMQATTMALVNGSVSDKALIGVTCEDWGFTFTSDPGRDNALFTSNWVGTGKFAKPSNISLPSPYAEHSLNAGGLSTLSLVNFDYLSNKRLNSVQFNWKNNMRPGFYPGSGSQNNFQIQGRLRRGTPTISLKSSVQCDSGSSEEDALVGQTVGTGTILVTGALITGSTYHSFKITFHRLLVNAAKRGDSNGISSWDVEYTVQQHATNGVLTVEHIIEQDNVLVAAS